MKVRSIFFFLKVKHVFYKLESDYVLCRAESHILEITIALCYSLTKQVSAQS